MRRSVANIISASRTNRFLRAGHQSLHSRIIVIKSLFKAPVPPAEAAVTCHRRVISRITFPPSRTKRNTRRATGGFNVQFDRQRRNEGESSDCPRFAPPALIPIHVLQTKRLRFDLVTASAAKGSDLFNHYPWRFESRFICAHWPASETVQDAKGVMLMPFDSSS